MNEENTKKLKIHNLIGFGVGNMIGTGIFVMLGYGISYTGRSIPLALLCSCLFMLLSNWFALGMSCMFVFKGGDYAMKSMMFNPLLTGVNAWLNVLNSFGLASLGLALAGYVCVMFPSLTPYTKWVAFAVITISFIVTIFGSRKLTIVENWITVVLMIALGLFVCIGIFHVNPQEYFSNSYDGGIFHGGLAGFLGAISIMSFTCMGQTSVTSMAAVSEKPKKTIPLAMLLITLLVGIVYALMAYVAAGVLPYDQIADANLSVAAESIFSKGLYLFFVVGGGICAIESSLLSTLGYIRYPLIQIAEEGWLPKIFRKQDKNGYPYVTYGIYYLVGILPLLLNMEIDSVISLIMIPMMLIQAYLDVACLKLPNQFPKQWEKRTIRMPKWLFYFCGVAGMICSFIIIYNLFINLNLHEMILSVVIIAVLFVLSAIRLKQGAVKPEDLKVRKDALIAEALSPEEN